VGKFQPLVALKMIGAMTLIVISIMLIAKAV
jgi:hypothetical protein